MPRLTCTYTSYTDFHIPKKVYDILLKEEENGVLDDGKAVGTWWVRWGVFHYIDADGDECTIEKDSECVNNKNPDDQEWIDEDEEEEEEEEDEEEEDEEEEDEEEDKDTWCYDGFMLQLNHGNCELDGRHSNTSDEDWELFQRAGKRVDEDDYYTEEIWTELQNRLLERDGKITYENDD